MEIISLLGVILDRVAFLGDIEWDYNEDSSIEVMLPACVDIDTYAESLLENDDYIEAENYKSISVIFEDKRVSKVYFDSEVHDVKECIDRYVNDWHIEDIYIILCLKITSLLIAQN